MHFGTYRSAALRGGGFALPKPVLLILVVEAEPVTQQVVNEALSGAGFDAEITSSGKEAVTLIRGIRADTMRS